MLRGLRASVAAMVGQAVILVRIALEDDQSFVQTNAPRVYAGVLFLLSSDQQPQEHTAHYDSKRHMDPSFGAVGGPLVQGAADARDGRWGGRRAPRG